MTAQASDFKPDFGLCQCSLRRVHTDAATADDAEVHGAQRSRPGQTSQLGKLFFRLLELEHIGTLSRRSL